MNSINALSSMYNFNQLQNQAWPNNSNPLFSNNQNNTGLNLFSSPNPMASNMQPQFLQQPQQQMGFTQMLMMLLMLASIAPDNPMVKGMLEMLGLKQPENNTVSQQPAARVAARRNPPARRTAPSSTNSSERTSPAKETSSEKRAESNEKTNSSKQKDKADNNSKSSGEIRAEFKQKAKNSDNDKVQVKESKESEKLTQKEKDAVDKDLTKKDITKKEYDKTFDEKIDKAKAEADEVFKNEWSEENAEVKEHKPGKDVLWVTKTCKLDDGRTLVKRSGVKKDMETKQIKNKDGEIIYQEKSGSYMSGAFLNKETITDNKRIIAQDEDGNCLTRLESNHSDGSYEIQRKHTLDTEGEHNLFGGTYIGKSKTYINENGEERNVNSSIRNFVEITEKALT